MEIANRIKIIYMPQKEFETLVFITPLIIYDRNEEEFRLGFAWLRWGFKIEIKRTK